MRPKPNDYRKIIREILPNVKLEEYDKWLGRKEARLFSQRDFFLVWSGIRLGRGFSEQITWEKLNEQLPMSDKEAEYYENLCKS
jgi:hypothetical protein